MLPHFRPLVALCLPLALPALWAGQEDPAASDDAQTEAPADTAAPIDPLESILTSFTERALAGAQRRLEDSLELWQDHSTWENAWRIESKNYRVRTTRSWAYGNQVAQNLEVMHGHFQEILGTSFDHPQPVEIWLLPNLGAYNTYANNQGAHHSSALGCFISDETDRRVVITYYDPNATQVGMMTTHGALHLFAEGVFARQPSAWLLEGLASYFSYYYWAYDYSFQRFPKGDDFVPLGTLLSADISQYVNDPGAYFSELAVLFTYLFHHSTYQDELLAAIQESVHRMDLTRAEVYQELVDHLPGLEAELLDFVSAH